MITSQKQGGFNFAIIFFLNKEQDERNIIKKKPKKKRSKVENKTSVTL